jgi:rhamnosyltransferase
MIRQVGQAVGVVIRTLDESELVGTCLETLRRQHGSFDLDVLVVDSGSTDSTVEIARSLGARVVELPPAAFDYSTALNLGIDGVRGDIVLSLSAHAIPVDEHWLATMIAAFQDPGVAGVSCRQVPWPDAPWKETERLRRVFGDTQLVYGPADAAGVVFSNAASGIRRSVWRDHPFTLPAVEDLEWARRVVSAGWTIVYEPRATVFHSHEEGARAQARRLIDISRVHDADGGARTRRRTVRDAAGLLYRDSRSIVGLDEPVRRKLVYLGELARTAYYYVTDFPQPGTTAERRRRVRDA